jgi:hypothetical protein
MLGTFNDWATYKEILTTIWVSNKLQELSLDETGSKTVVEVLDIEVELKLESGFATC